MSKRRVCKFTNKLENDFPFLKKVGGNDSRVKCQHCLSEFSVAHSGRGNIIEHLQSVKHKTGATASANSLSMTTFYKSAEPAQDDLAIAANEATFARHTTMNDVSFKTSDCKNQESESTKQNKRTDVLSWGDYFMALACVAAKRSKDPATTVGACIVNPDRRVVALGYNGMPNGCNDDEMPWGKTGNWEDTKYPYVCHAEMNAILNKTSSDLKNCTLYTTKFPCNECAKLIIQAGITQVFFRNNIDSDRKKETVASKMLLDKAKVSYSRHESRAKIEIDLSLP